MPLPVIAATPRPAGQQQPLGGQRISASQIARQRALADALAQQASNARPAYGGTYEVLARTLAGLTSGLANRRADRQETEIADRRAAALAAVLEGGDLRALANSGDPQLENMAFEMTMAQRQAAGDAPESRTIRSGNQFITQRWNRETRQWEDEATSPIRTGSGSARPSMPRTREVPRGNEIIVEEFDDQTGTFREIGRRPIWNPNTGSGRMTDGEVFRREQMGFFSETGIQPTEDQIRTVNETAAMIDTLGGNSPNATTGGFGIGPAAPAAPGAIGALPLPPGATPEMLIVGQMYQTERGPAVWNGTEFIQP